MVCEPCDVISIDQSEGRKNNTPFMTWLQNLQSGSSFKV